MFTRPLTVATILCGGIVAIGQLTDSRAGLGSGHHLTPGEASEHITTEEGAITAQGEGGPDVIVSIISGTWHSAGSGFRVYSAGTTSCNQGTVPLEWFANTNRHPVIGQNMFRLAPRQNGHLRFEQLGQSWLKHGFCALDNNYGTCTGCQGSLGCNYLQVGCEDPYSATLNASQSSAGPKFEVNATTGFFPYPPSNPSWSGPIARRLQVPMTDVDPAKNPGAEFIIEAQYVHPQDAPAANWAASLNNVSYRRMAISPNGAFNAYDGPTIQMQPAIHRWQAVDPLVTLSNIDVVDWGRMMVASRAYDNGDGTWDYEYAVYNMHFDRAIGSFSVPLPAGATVTDVEFRDIRYHSGELFEYSGTEGHWLVTMESGAISWKTPESYLENVNANAIRWGTLYNFRFTANVEPINGLATLGAFNPFPADQPQSFTGAARIPGTLGTDCPADLDGNGVVDLADLLLVLGAWGPCDRCPEDLDGNDVVDLADLLLVLAFWGPC